MKKNLIIFFILVLVFHGKNLMADELTTEFFQIEGQIESTTNWYQEDPKKEDEGIFLNNCLHLKIKDNLPLFGKSGFFANFRFTTGEKEILGSMRETYLNINFPSDHLRIGWQYINWGISNFLPVTDILNPLDFTDFTYTKTEDHKLNVFAFKYTYDFKNGFFELAVIPLFKKHKFADEGNWVFFNPFSDNVFLQLEPEIEPQNSFEEMEYGFRLATYSSAIDFQLNYYSGWDDNPNYDYVIDYELGFPVIKITPIYHRIIMWGGSITFALIGSIIKTEMAYKITEDPHGDDFSIKNSSLHYLLGVEKTWAGNFSIGVEFFEEKMLNYLKYTASIDPFLMSSDVFEPAKKKTKKGAAYISHALFHDLVKIQLSSIYNFNDKDYLFLGEIKHLLFEDFSYTLGLLKLGGIEETTFFGQFDKNDVFFIKWNYSF